MENFATPQNTLGAGNVTLETDPCVPKNNKRKKKHISDYIKSKQISESLSAKQKNLLGNMFVNMFLHSKVKKDDVKRMLGFLVTEQEILIAVCDYLNEYDQKHAFAYLPERDDLLNKENYEKIIDNLAEYVVKFLCD